MPKSLLANFFTAAALAAVFLIPLPVFADLVARRALEHLKTVKIVRWQKDLEEAKGSPIELVMDWNSLDEHDEEIKKLDTECCYNDWNPVYRVKLAFIHVADHPAGKTALKKIERLVLRLAPTPLEIKVSFKRGVIDYVATPTSNPADFCDQLVKYLKIDLPIWVPGL